MNFLPVRGLLRHFKPNIAAVRHFPTLREKANPPTTEELYEPKFKVERPYPDYQLLNVRLQAYDFLPLEKFQRYVHWAAKHFGFNVVKSYAQSHTSENVKEFKPGSTVPIDEYDLKTYDRVVRIGPVPAIQLSLFIMLINAHVPIGVKITLKEHETADERYRYIPDPQLEEIKETLKNLDNPIVRKSLGWEA